MSHELVEAFDAAGLPLCRTLCEMLDEHPAHGTDRRGCGLTQATRFLSQSINTPADPCDPADLRVFRDIDARRAHGIGLHARRHGWTGGWRDLGQAPDALRRELAGLPGGASLLDLDERVRAVGARLEREESRIVLALVEAILHRRASPLPPLPPMPDKPEIGSCSQAEEFFLEIAHGKIRRGGRVNLFVDGDGRPVLVEKVALGESHSAMFVGPAQICRVPIPPGSIAALAPAPGAQALSRHPHGEVFALSALARVRFLRISTLSVSPAHRARAFGMQFQRQRTGNMLSPGTTGWTDLHRYAENLLDAHPGVL